MSPKKKGRKPSRVVFSLGAPLPVVRIADRLFRRCGFKTRNAYVVSAIVEKNERENPPLQRAS